MPLVEPLAKVSKAVSCKRCAWRLPIAPHTQLRSSPVSWMRQRLFCKALTAASGLLAAKRIKARVTSSLVLVRKAVILSFR